MIWHELRGGLQRYDGLVAAMGGMLKDADGGLSVESPIFLITRILSGWSTKAGRNLVGEFSSCGINNNERR